ARPPASGTLAWRRAGPLGAVTSHWYETKRRPDASSVASWTNVIVVPPTLTSVRLWGGPPGVDRLTSSLRTSLSWLYVSNTTAGGAGSCSAADARRRSSISAG